MNNKPHFLTQFAGSTNWETQQYNQNTQKCGYSKKQNS